MKAKYNYRMGVGYVMVDGEQRSYITYSDEQGKTVGTIVLPEYAPDLALALSHPTGEQDD